MQSLKSQLFSRGSTGRARCDGLSGLLVVGHLADEERYAGDSLVVHAHIHGIQAGFVELQLLNVDDEIAGARPSALMKLTVNWRFPSSPG